MGHGIENLALFGGKQFYILCGTARKVKISKLGEDGLWLVETNPHSLRLPWYVACEQA